VSRRVFLHVFAARQADSVSGALLAARGLEAHFAEAAHNGRAFVEPRLILVGPAPAPALLLPSVGLASPGDNSRVAQRANSP
jgi:hypothetical protein